MPTTKLELSAALAEQVLDTIEEALIVFDRRDRVRYWNRAFESLWNLDKADLRRAKIDFIVAMIEERTLNGCQLEGLHAHLEDARQPRSIDIQLDSDHFVELSMKPLLHHGRPDGRVWRSRDLTAQKRSELAMLHAQKLESLGVLAGGIAHDFNNLLSTMLGNSELGLGEIDPESPAGDSFRAISKAAERASELTQQLLAYAGKGTVLVEPVELSALVADVVEMVAISIPESVRLELDLAAELPPIIADATQIRQVAMNLLLNAAEAIPQAGEISVTTGTRRVERSEITDGLHHQETAPGDFVFLRVEDSGDGMDEATMARIFDPFFSTKFTGRGLGLAGVLGIVRRHRGLLQVQSSPGKGTAIAIHLPHAQNRPK